MKNIEVRKKIGVKVIAVTTSLALTMCTLSGCGSNETEETVAITETQEKESGVLEAVLDKQINHSTDSDVDKEESVYVLADAAGNTTQIIVSDWLKNMDGSEKLEDASDLADIINLKGEETYTKDGDKLIWNADGSDIHYQGTSNKELPVDVNVTYYLEGEEISPDELAGKSGNVKIRFDYNNHESASIEVNGKQEDVHIPFTVLSAMMLPNDIFSHIEVTNGKVVSEGNTNIVVGLGFPGLKDSLKLDDTILGGDKEINIPDYVEVSAYAEDFSLDMTMSVVLSDVLSKVNLTDDIDLSEITDAVDELSDAATQLVDGSGELKDGITTLSEKSVEFGDGIDTLHDGIVTYTDGVATLSDGIITYTDGVAALSDGIVDYTDGVAKLGDGIVTYTDGVAKLGNGINNYTDGVAKLSAGITAYTDGADTLSSGIGSLKDGVSSVNDGAAQLAEGLSTADMGAKQLIAGYEGTETQPGALAGAQQLAGGLDLCYQQVQSGLNTGLGNLSFMTGLNINELTKEKCMELATLASGDKTQVPINTDYISSLATQTAELTYEVNQKDAQSSISKKLVKNTDNTDTDEKETEDSDMEEETNDSNIGEDTDDSENGEDAAESSNDESEESDNNSEEDKNGENTNEEEDNNGESTNTEENNNGESTNTEENNNGESTNTEENNNGESTNTEENNNGESTNTEEDKNKESENKEEDKFEKYVSITLGQLNEQQQMVGYVAIAQIGTLAASLTSMFDLQDGLAQLSTGAVTLSAGINQLYAGTVQVQTGLDQLSTGADALYGGTQQLNSGAEQLQNGVKELSGASGALKNGASELTSASGELKKGVSELTSASGELKGGASELTSASGKLKGGASELTSASGELKGGASELTSASTDLRDGAGELADGKNQLMDGIGELEDGAIKLNNGMIQFDEEGISKITDGLGNGAEELKDRITAIMDAGSNYNTFAGLSDGRRGSVKFIIKTDAIK